MLELEGEVRVIKEVDADVTILTTTGVAATIRVECQGVNGTEVPLHTAKLFFEHLTQVEGRRPKSFGTHHVVEASVELSLLASGCGYLHSFLSTTENNVLLKASVRTQDHIIDEAKP